MNELFIVWITTFRCNLTCKHRYVRGRVLGDDLTTEEVKLVTKKLSKFGPADPLCFLASNAATVG